MSGFVVQGRGGGKGGGGSASEEKDSLRSTQIAEIIDVISEGECEGLVGGAKGVYLDGVPLQNDDDSFNFSGVQLAWTPGTQGQAALPGVSAVQSEVGVNVAVTKAAPVVRTIASTSVDKCRVTIAVPRLTFQDPSSGDIKGTSFEWAIDVQSSGGGYVEVYSGKVEGKTNSSYTKSVEFDLPGAAPWDVRLRRITDDATTSNINNAFNWFSYTAIQSVKLRYPNTAYTYLRIDAEQFSNVPDRTFKWRGVRIRVPTNYDPVARSYSGTWDGTFKIAYSNNPAWVFFDMVTHERYGLGEYIDVSQVNKWALYAIGQYCDEMVPDGYGGVEPRFTINVQLRDRVEAYKLMQDLSSVFRGMAYWSGSSLEVFQDAPEDASLLYTPANVVDGNFSYEDTSEKSLHSVFICYWHDMAQAAKKVPEVYAPNDLIQRYGVREIEMTTMGVTSRGMAARLCRWARHSEQMEGGQVGFTVGSDGVVATPGKVFAVADPNVAGERLAGRIIAATSSSIGLDAPVNLASGEVYTVTVLKPSAAEHMQYETEERTITTAAGADITSISVSPSFTFTPVVGTIWMIQSTTIAPTLWRCLGVNELSGKNQYAITGVAHNPSKFASIEYGLTLDTPIITRIKTAATPPSSLALVEEIYTDGTVNKSALTISFVPAKDSRRHKISYRQDTGWWVDLPDTSEQSVTIRGLDPGVYDVVVRSVNGLGNVSQAVQDTITLAGGRSGIRQVRLKASSMTFKVPSSGSASPSTISITADTGALDESGLTWSVTGATLTGSGQTRSLAYANMSADVCMVTATVSDGGSTFSDTITIIKVYDGMPGTDGSDGAPGEPGTTGADGAPAVSASMTLDSIGLPADATGAVTSYTGASSSMVVFMGGAVDTTNWSFSHVASGVTVTRSTNTVTVTAMSAGTEIGYVDVTATRYGYASITKRVTVSKYKTGATGATGANATAYWMTTSAPAVQKSVAGAFTPASVTVALYSATGSSAPVAYAGRFIIATSADGLTFSDAYTSASNEASKTFTVPGGIKAIRFRAYAAGGTTTLLDEEITTVVSDGVSAVYATCSNEAHTLAANTDGTVTSYVGSGCEIRVSEGATELAYDGSGVTNGTWKVSLTASNITPGALTDSGTYLTVGAHSGVAAATDVASITYTITGKTSAGAPFTIVKQQSFSKSKAGRRGSVQLAASTTGTTWSDSVATAAVVAAGYTEPVDRDVVTLVNASAKWSEARAYVSGSWLTLAAYISGNMMVDGTVLAQHLNVTSLSAITGNMGSLTAGSITLDASGFIRAGQTAYNTGSGFWVGYSGGAYKFSLGSPTQGITWDGSTLTMSGNLNAAGGTFAGTLTAAAVNAVNTINIAGNAVTVPVSAQWSGSISASSIGGEQTIVSTASTSFGGGNVVVVAQIDGYAQEVTVDSGANFIPPTIRLYRNGTLIRSASGWAAVSGVAGGVIVFQDSPGSSAAVYTLKFYESSGYWAFVATSATIVATGSKR